VAVVACFGSLVGRADATASDCALYLQKIQCENYKVKENHKIRGVSSTSWPQTGRTSLSKHVFDDDSFSNTSQVKCCQCEQMRGGTVATENVRFRVATSRVMRPNIPGSSDRNYFQTVTSHPQNTGLSGIYMDSGCCTGLHGSHRNLGYSGLQFARKPPRCNHDGL